MADTICALPAISHSPSLLFECLSDRYNIAFPSLHKTTSLSRSLTFKLCKLSLYCTFYTLITKMVSSIISYGTFHAWALRPGETSKW